MTNFENMTIEQLKQWVTNHAHNTTDVLPYAVDLNYTDEQDTVVSGNVKLDA